MHANWLNLPQITETESKVSLRTWLNFTIWACVYGCFAISSRVFLKSGNHKSILNTATASSL